MSEVVPVSRPPEEYGPRPVEIVSAFKLLRDFKPIESIIDGLPTGRGALVSLTAPTGHGKTTITTLMHVALCRGLTFAGRAVTRGAVLVLAGENPDDYTMHLAATAQDDGLTGEDLSKTPGHLLVIPGTFAIDFEIGDILERLKAMRVELVAVFVDTSAAFYGGEDENSNTDMRKHASMLRELTKLPGNPTTIVLCHPTKNAQRDSLLPRGGGAFLAEVDANLTLWKDEAGIISLHWAGKIRGPAFDPVRFELAPIELSGFKDCRGQPIWSVAARHLPDDQAEQLRSKAVDDDDRLLVALQRRPGASVRDLAIECGWTSGMGKPLHARADRRLKTLESQGLTQQDRRGKWSLTPKGAKEADRLP